MHTSIIYSEAQADEDYYESLDEAIRYQPSTDSYIGGLANGDCVTDGQNTFIVTRRSGFTLELDLLSEGRRKIVQSRSVDPSSLEFKGDLFKVA